MSVELAFVSKAHVFYFPFPAFQVDEGGRVPLSIHQLLATDYDTAMEELVVTIITLPIYGCIENTKTGKLYMYLFSLSFDQEIGTQNGGWGFHQGANMISRSYFRERF